MKDLEDMKASNIGLKMMQEQALIKEMPLTQNFIRQLHKVLLREDNTVYRELPGGLQPRAHHAAARVILKNNKTDSHHQHE